MAFQERSQGKEVFSPKLEIRPSFEEIKALAEPDSLIPIYCELPSDMYTVHDAYWRLSNGGSAGSFILEGNESPEKMGRYSYVGADPVETLIVSLNQTKDPLRAVEKSLTRKAISLPQPHILPPFLGGWVGFLAYGYIKDIEQSVPRHQKDPLSLPKSIFFRVNELVAFDQHPLRQTITAITHMPIDTGRLKELHQNYEEAQGRISKIVRQLKENPSLPQVLPPKRNAIVEEWANMTRGEYEEKVRRIKEYILEGDNFQTVLSLRISRRTPAQPFEVYRQLCKTNPSPYMVYIDFGDDLKLVGSPPELISKLENGVVTTNPLAGTRRRGKTDEEDRQLQEELRTNEKERAEHTMLVDLARNDLGRVVVYGTEKVTELMEVVPFVTVSHMRSIVEGQIQPNKSFVDVIHATFPAGTVSGAPKVRAMQRIAQLEEDERGIYAGGVGYIDYKGDFELGIPLRTIVFTGDVAHIQAGAGIVADSNPPDEFAECLQKAAGPRHAIEVAETKLGITPL